MRRLAILILLAAAPARADFLEPGPPARVEGPSAMTPWLVSEVYGDFQLAHFPSGALWEIDTSHEVYLWRWAVGGSLKLGPVALDVELPMHAAHVSDGDGSAFLFGHSTSSTGSYGTEGGAEAPEWLVAFDQIKTGVRVLPFVRRPRPWLDVRLALGTRLTLPTESSRGAPGHPPPSFWSIDIPLLFSLVLGPVALSTNQGPIIYGPDERSASALWDALETVMVTPHWRVSFGVGFEALVGLGAPGVSAWALPTLSVRPVRTQHLDLSARVHLPGTDRYDGGWVTPLVGADWALALRYTFELPGRPRLR